jgi:hypothetical protein
MKKILLITTIVVLCIVIFIGVIYLYLNIPRKVKIYEEYRQIYSERETGGEAWGIIFDNEGITLIGENLGIEIPKIDFKKYNLLWSDGKKIKEITYTIGSKYKWWFDHPMGEAIFGNEHYLHTIFIYKIERVIVLMDSP